MKLWNKWYRDSWTWIDVLIPFKMFYRSAGLIRRVWVNCRLRCGFDSFFFLSIELCASGKADSDIKNVDWGEIDKKAFRCLPDQTMNSNLLRNSSRAWTQFNELNLEQASQDRAKASNSHVARLKINYRNCRWQWKRRRGLIFLPW